MSIEAIVGAIVLSWLTSLLTFPIVPLQHWLNSRLLLLWRTITLKPRGLTGRWLAVYEIPHVKGAPERRTEIVTCNHLSGNEIRGKIRDENTGNKYAFVGRVVFDELVAHYWSTDETRDIGAYKFALVPGVSVLQGPLTLYDSRLKETKSGINYSWYRYPGKLSRRLMPVRVGVSHIEGAGLFANTRFAEGEEIGKLAVGPEASQGKHTICLNGHHRIVKKPWRFLNHSCEPNARLEISGRTIALMALKEILPQTEITFDYKSLKEPIADHFDCRCPKCARSEASLEL